MSLVGSMILAPNKVYAAELTSEGETNSGIENSLYSSEVLEDVKSISSIDYDKKEDAQKWIDDTTDNLKKIMTLSVKK